MEVIKESLRDLVEEGFTSQDAIGLLMIQSLWDIDTSLEDLVEKTDDISEVINNY